MDDANTTEKTGENAGTELTISDLAACKSIIDVASTRGAFKPNEMVAVGTVYNKIDAFLTAAQAAQKAPAENA
jgi:hypothetical protein